MMVGMGRARAYIGLGSNVGDGPSALAAAIGSVSAIPGARLAAVSDLYETRPVGLIDQPDFANAVLALDVPCGPDPAGAAMALLGALKEVERSMGRQERPRWGRREIDLDLLVFGRHALRVERPAVAGDADPAGSPDPAKSRVPSQAGGRWLEVPHPGAASRLFVLAPIADLAPGLVPPGWGETVASAMRRAIRVEGADAVRRAARWDPSRNGWVPYPS